MKNVLFISYDGMTDPLGQSQVIPYLVGLTKHGYHFTILSCEKKERYLSNKNEVEILLKPYPIKWVPISYHKRPPVISSIYDVLTLKKNAKRLHVTEKFDMVHTRPGVPALIGLWMKKRFGVKFLNDIREFYSDSRIDGGIWNKKNFFYNIIYNYFKKKEEEAVEQSDGIVCLTYAAEKVIKKWSQYKIQTPLQVIPCSVDMNLFDPAQIDPTQKLRLKKELNIVDNDFIISYLGSIGSWYLIDELMIFFKIIIDEIPHARFLFISPHQHETIIIAAKRAGLDESKIIVQHANRKEVPVLLSFSKYSVFFIKSCYSKLSSSPTKHGEIMAMGIPVISNAGVGDIKEIVEKYSSGIIANPLNEREFKSIAELISKGIYFDNDLIRQGANEFYNLKNAVNKYHLLYNSIMK